MIVIIVVLAGIVGVCRGMTITRVAATSGKDIRVKTQVKPKSGTRHYFDGRDG